jgi:hypothetical protein
VHRSVAIIISEQVLSAVVGALPVSSSFLAEHVDGVYFLMAMWKLPGFEDGGRRVEVRQRDRCIVLAAQADVDAQNSRCALRMRGDAAPTDGARPERYVSRCGLHYHPDDGVARFHPSCSYGIRRVPCYTILYLYICSNEPKAIGHMALGVVGKMVWRMSFDAIVGSAIKIDDVDVEHCLAIGEGSETVLAAPQLGFWPASTFGSAVAVRNLTVLAGIECLNILVNNDEPDRRGRQAVQKAATACSARWRTAGVQDRRIAPRAACADMVLKGSRHAA